MIIGDDITRAERTLTKTRASVVAPNVLYDRAMVLPEACDNFMARCLELLRERVPDLDPRAEPTFNTLIRHAFLVGAVCGREEANR